ncbi:MAG TPA: hypothetical protein VHO28_07480 [Ignavibacteriales bacterium]|nr:hypothetical protein [Ignavibacteriales bacterium]
MSFFKRLKKSAYRWIINKMGRHLKGFWSVVKMFNPAFEANVDKVNEMIESLSFRLEKEGVFRLALKLRGEDSPILANADLRHAADKLAPFIYIEDITFSREWLNILIKNFAEELFKPMGMKVVGNKVYLPEEYASKMRKILPE